MSSSFIDISTSPSLPLTPLQINTKLYSKYNSSNISYGIKKIDDLIFLETSLYTNKFREFLLYDEEIDFLRRYYHSSELHPKLKKILSFYSKYSKIFPNYIIMSGSHYLYKNIQKKQKMINNLQELKQQERKNRKLCLSITNISNIIGASTMNSILNISNSFYKKQLMSLFKVDNGDESVNGYDDVDKLVRDIEKAERGVNSSNKRKVKKNVVMIRPFSLMERSINNNNNNSNYTSQHKFNNKFISSAKLTNNKTRLVLHKKISSQGLFTLNTKFNTPNNNNNRNNKTNSNSKKKVLTLDINSNSSTNNSNSITNKVLTFPIKQQTCVLINNLIYIINFSYF